MTKVSDLPEPIQKQLEQLDQYIQKQVAIAEYLKDNKSSHQDLIESIPRDITFLEKKYVSTNQSLNTDLKFAESFKNQTLESFNEWVEKLIKVYLQLTNPIIGSSSVNDQSKSSSTPTLIIGVNGNRTSNTPQISKPQQSNSSDDKKESPLNVTRILNSYYVTKIEDFKDKIEKYQLILQEVENSINDLDKNSLNRGMHGGANGLEMIVSTLQEEFKLYVEIANEFAEIHHNVGKLKGSRDEF
ncbi:unnamed protein product [Ambrosiozyma monospora]|uniref:Unnamed protein product n=1 Tax=Ambrosiozyma monospora TaxID=43982 RepID=A0ACB5TK27_AMBMO|nr:unnamed protein product [Ambrosiozyma monospora]